MPAPEREFLLRTGMVNQTVYAGIQPDDCVVWKKVPGGYVDHTLCNHSCVIEVNGKATGGNYVCDASFVFAKGSPARFAPRKMIVGWTATIATAQALARDMFFDRHFDAYCEEFRVPPAWAEAMKAEITSPDKKVEVNRFGGSPSMHRDCAGIISDSKALGLVVNLTDPGRRLMTDAQFVKDFAANPPQMLALSFDDVELEELERLSAMDLDRIKAEWKTISPHHGQRQKAYEGFYAAKLMKEMGAPVRILFNVVIHPGNIDHLDELLATLTKCVPGSFANPYPAQSFGNGRSCWTVESLLALRSHIKRFIEGTLAGTPGVTRRLSYYVVLEAAFRNWKRGLERLAAFMSGIGAWDITLRPGAYRYAQIGKSLKVVTASSYEDLPYPGGHLGCFWNPVLGLPEQISSNVEAEADKLTTGMVERGENLRKRSGLVYVQTSNIMPRLMFDMLSTELGIPVELVPAYLETRREYCGF